KRCADARSGRTTDNARMRIDESTRIARGLPRARGRRHPGKPAPARIAAGQNLPPDVIAQRIDFLGNLCGTRLASAPGMKTIMLHETPVSHPFASVGPVVQRLLDELSGAEAGDSRVRALLERALAFAAAAETRMAEQSRRIAFLEGLSRTDE